MHTKPVILYKARLTGSITESCAKRPDKHSQYCYTSLVKHHEWSDRVH